MNVLPLKGKRHVKLTTTVLFLSCVTGMSLGGEIPGEMSQTAYLGMAYDSVGMQFINARCVTGTETVVTDNTVAYLKTEKDLTYTDIKDRLGGAVGLGSNFPSIAVEGEVEFMNENAASELVSNYVFTYRDTAFETVFSDDASRQLTPLCDIDRGNPMVNGASIGLAEVPEYFGDSWIRAIHWGAKLSVSLKIQFKSKYDKELFSGAIGISAGEVLVVDGNYTTEQSKRASETVITLSVHQNGGNPANIIDSIPENFITCSFDDVDACISSFNSIVSYATNSLRTELENAKLAGALDKSKWVPVKYVYDTYASTYDQLYVDRWISQSKADYNFQLASIESNLTNTLNGIAYVRTLLQSDIDWTPEFNEVLTTRLAILEENKFKYADMQSFCLSHPDRGECGIYVAQMNVSFVGTGDLLMSSPEIDTWVEFDKGTYYADVWFNWKAIGVSNCTVTLSDEYGTEYSASGIENKIIRSFYLSYFVPGKEYSANFDCIGYDKTFSITKTFTINKDTFFVVIGSGVSGYYPRQLVTPASGYSIDWNVPAAASCKLSYPYFSYKFGSGTTTQSVAVSGSRQNSFYYPVTGFAYKVGLECKNSAGQDVFNRNVYLHY